MGKGHPYKSCLACNVEVHIRRGECPNCQSPFPKRPKPADREGGGEEEDDDDDAEEDEDAGSGEDGEDGGQRPGGGAPADKGAATPRAVVSPERDDHVGGSSLEGAHGDPEEPSVALPALHSNTNRHWQAAPWAGPAPPMAAPVPVINAQAATRVLFGGVVGGAAAGAAAADAGMAARRQPQRGQRVDYGAQQRSETAGQPLPTGQVLIPFQDRKAAHESLRKLLMFYDLDRARECWTNFLRRPQVFTLDMSNITNLADISPSNNVYQANVRDLVYEKAQKIFQVRGPFEMLAAKLGVTCDPETRVNSAYLGEYDNMSVLWAFDMPRRVGSSEAAASAAELAARFEREMIEVFHPMRRNTPFGVHFENGTRGGNGPLGRSNPHTRYFGYLVHRLDHCQ